MKFFHRSISNRERMAIEREAVDRYKRHVDVPRMTAELRGLRDGDEAMRELLHSHWAEFRRTTRVEMEALIGPPPTLQMTPIVMTPEGQFASVAGGS